MKIEIKLLSSRTEKPEGFPLIIEIAHANVRKIKQLALCKKEHFSQSAKMISEKHPDFDILAPILMGLKLKARKIMLERETDVDAAMKALFKNDTSGITIQQFYETLKTQMQELAAKHDKNKDTAARNKILGNLKVYDNAITQFTAVLQDVPLAKLEYEDLLRFKNYQLGLGNSKSTVNLYLRTLRAIYNKGVLLHKLPAAEPFKGLFAGLKVKSYANKKKYLTKQSIAVLEGVSLTPGQQQYVDLFLLQFYFGGADLIDIYYLKKVQMRKGRVYFERSKTEGGLMLDLKIHPKAQALLNKYTSPDEWHFPWRKDIKGYEGFRRRYQRALIDVQAKQAKAAENAGNDDLKIEVEPGGGNLGVKVARHTFANIAKSLMIDVDVIRELMGHERDDVDNYYKDKHSQAVRDEALFRIVD